MDNFAPRGATPDRTIPRFHIRPVEMPFKSREAGRPIFEDREFVEIIIPGMSKSTACEPVNDEHKTRWPAQYDAFKRGQEMPTTGTPLEQWPILTPATVQNMKAINLRTVEDLAAAPDAVLQNLGQGGLGFRQRAVAFLDAAKGAAPLERAQQLIEQQQAQIEMLQGQVRDLAALVKSQEPDGDEAAPRRRTQRTAE